VTLDAIAIFVSVVALILGVAALLVATDARRTADMAFRRRHLGEHNYQNQKVFR